MRDNAKFLAVVDSMHNALTLNEKREQIGLPLIPPNSGELKPLAVVDSVFGKLLPRTDSSGKVIYYIKVPDTLPEPPKMRTVKLDNEPPDIFDFIWEALSLIWNWN